MATLIETAARVGKEIAIQPAPKSMSEAELKAACKIFNEATSQTERSIK